MSVLREAWTEDATIADGAATSGAVFIGDASFGMVFTPAEWDSASMTFHVAYTERGTPTYVELVDEDGSAISITVAASKAAALPSALFGARTFKVVANGNQTGATVLRFALKG